MRRIPLIAAACVLAGASVASADVAPFARYDGEIHRGTYDWSTGRMTPARFDATRGGDAPMWAAEFLDPNNAHWAGGYAYSNGGVIGPDFIFAMHWGDLPDAGDPTRSVGSFMTGWVSNHTLDPTGETGLYMLLAWYRDFDGITAVQDFPAGYYEPDVGHRIPLDESAGVRQRAGPEQSRRVRGLAAAIRRPDAGGPDRSERPV